MTGRTNFLFSRKTHVVVAVVVILVIIVISNRIAKQHNARHTGSEGVICWEGGSGFQVWGVGARGAGGAAREGGEWELCMGEWGLGCVSKGGM